MSKNRYRQDAHPNTDRQRRREEKQQLHFLIRVAIFVKENLAKGRETHQQRGQRSGPPHLQDQGEQQIFAGR